MKKEAIICKVPDKAITYANGYVYINIDSEYNAAKRQTKYERKCIGKLNKDKMLIANDFYIYTYLNNNETIIEELKLKILELQAELEQYRTNYNNLKKEIDTQNSK